MKTKMAGNHELPKRKPIVIRALIVTVISLGACWCWSQSAPILTVTPVGTNQFSVTFTNSPPTTWDLQWTPALAGSEYNWSWIKTGTYAQTNFTVSMDDVSGSPTAFFRTILDTNSIPLWEAADPNNPAAGILTVTIDSPTNGETIQ